MRIVPAGLVFIMAFLLIFLIPQRSFSQEENGYDEISVFFEIPRVGGGEIPAVIRGVEVYLPVAELFDFLKIKNQPSDDLNMITGFFISPEATYTVDRTTNTIIYQGVTYDLADGDLVRTETSLYLRSFYFGKIFGLDCRFNFRTLSVVMETRIELPLIREMRQEEMRRNITRLKGEIKADSSIGRDYPGFRFGMADWSAIATEQINGPVEARLNLALGAMIAGGEATASLNYNSSDPFTEKQQYYLWRYVNNDHSALRQILAGKISSHSTSSIYNPVVGVQITNTPTTFRRSFGSYTLSDRTEPGWIVELYVNNILVDYIKADASGFFTFEVPLVYGNSMVKLKFYGPWGEERVREQNINIPFNFLPKNTLEYTASAGMVEDTLHSIFSKGSVNYGLTRSLTVGGGVEYLSSVTSGPLMPYLNASLRITNNLLVSGEYTYGVRAKGTLTYRLPSNIQLDLNYTKYDRDQKAINYNYLEERRASLSVPFRTKSFSAYTRMSFYQIVLPTTYYTTGEWLLSGQLFGINTNLTTYALFIGQNEPYIYSNLSLALRLPAGFVMIPQGQYGYTQHQILSAKLGIEKHLFVHGFMNLALERNFRSNLSVGEVGFRYDFSFAQTGMSVRQTNDRTSLVQYARGSLINDSRTKYLHADNRNNVGKGGITIVPYIDINANGKRDNDEYKLPGLNLHSSMGRVEISERDTTIRILGLEPYTKCFIELDENSFDNIAWRLKTRTYSVAVDPNQMKLLEVPVMVMGEASGTVNLEKEGETRGLGRIIVQFFTRNLTPVSRTLTEDDGYFSYLGLAPGSYVARVDTVQLRKLQMTSYPDSITFAIRKDIDGDIVEGLDFILRKTVIIDTSGQLTPTEEIVIRDTSYIIVHEEVRELVTITRDYLAIQLGAFKNREYAEAWQKRIAAVIDKSVEIISEDGYYKVRITGFEDRGELDSYIPALQKAGFTEIWVITNKAKKIEIITTKEDSIARITETNIGGRRQVVIPGMTVQIGAFTNSDEASAIVDRLLAAVENIVTVRTEDGVYKVQLSDMKDSAEIRRILPILNKQGFNNLLLITPPEANPVPVTGAKIDSMIVEGVRTMSEIKPPVIIEEPAVEIPRFILHAASFYKRARALQAQRKISRKLDVPVEIIQEWDSYQVVLTGFFTREETFRYYPELAGLGYSDVYVIEQPPQNK